MLPTIDRALLSIHVVTGFVSLVLFWFPIVTRKGRLLHRRVGIMYVYAMGVVIGNACILSLLNLYNGSIVSGLSLLFLSALSTLPLVSGVQILKSKKPTIQYRRLRIFLAVLLILTTVACLVGWYLFDHVILLVFGLIGMVAGGGDTLRFRREKGSGKTWLREHYEGMIFSGVATYTAFFAFGGRTWLATFTVGWWGIVPWVLPILLAIAILPLVHRAYKQQQSRQKSA